MSKKCITMAGILRFLNLNDAKMLDLFQTVDPNFANYGRINYISK